MTTMNHDDLEWLVAQRPEPAADDAFAHDRALHTLRSHIDTSGARAGTPRRACRGSRVWRSALPAAMSLGGVGAIAVAVLIAGSPEHAPSTSALAHPGAGPAVLHQHAAGRGTPLIRLAADVIKSPAPVGNATLVARSTTAADRQTTTVYDLYTDDGGYYFSRTESGLPAQMRGHDDQADGMFAREVAAAKLAATGSVQQAAQNMADAPDPAHVVPPSTVPSPTDIAAVQRKLAAIGGKSVSVAAARRYVGGGTLYDNYVWENSQDAIVAGSGDPQVRAGVLRILATLPGVTVSSQTTDGIPSLTLTGTAPEVGSDRIEALTINANTGVPIKFVGGPPSGPDGVITYVVSRVDTTHLAGATG